METDEQLERWEIRVPKTGTQGERRGEEAFVFDLSPAAGDELERTLRRVNPGLRRGRPILYRGSRQLEVDAVEAEDQVLSSVKAQDPEEQAQVMAVRELRDLRRQLAIDVDARRREIDRLEAAIVAAREERDREKRRIRAEVEEAEAHAQKLVRETRAHYDAEILRARKLHKELEEATTGDLAEIGKQIKLRTDARAELDRIMRAPTMVDVADKIKDAVVAASDSDLAQMVVSHISASVAAAVERRSGEKTTPADAMAAFVLQGRAGRQRHAAFRAVRHDEQVDPRKADLVLAGCDLFLGEIDLQTAARLCRRDLSVVPTT